MNNLREIAENPGYKTTTVKAVLTPFPVRFDFPDDLRETTPRATVKAIEGVRVLRFYTPPVPLDIIEFRGHLWKVLGRFHEDVKVRCSPQKDRMAIVITEYFGVKSDQD